MKTRIASLPLAVLGLCLSLWMAAGGVVVAAEETAPPPAAAPDQLEAELSALREELRLLKAENAKLRAENQLLRRLLGQTVAAPKPVIEASPAAASETNGVGQSTEAVPTHWLSSSGKRHNSGCRYFGNTIGRPCGANEGTPCKLCGG